MTEDMPITLLTNCLACQGVGEVHSYAGDCVQVCPACRGQHRPHTYKEGCKKYGEQEPKAEQPAGAPAPAASSSSSGTKRAAGDQESEGLPVTRKRTVRFDLGDPDAKVDTPGSSTSSSSAPPEPQVEEAAPPAPPVPQEEDVKSHSKESTTSSRTRLNYTSFT